MGKSLSSITGSVGNIISKVPIIGRPVGNLVKDVGNDVTDVTFGAETAATPDQLIDLGSKQGRGLQEQLLTKYGEGINNDTSKIAGSQIAAQENQARQNADDQANLARQLVNQRGLGGTAGGISQLLGGQQGLQNQLGAIRAQAPQLQEQLRRQNLDYASQGINQTLAEQGQSKIFAQGTAAQPRNGGILQGLSGGLGSALGKKFVG